MGHGAQLSRGGIHSWKGLWQHKTVDTIVLLVSGQARMLEHAFSGLVTSGLSFIVRLCCHRSVLAGVGIRGEE